MVALAEAFRRRRPGVAVVVDRQRQGVRGRRRVGGDDVGDRRAAGAEEQVVDLGDRAGEGQGGAARAHDADAGGAGGRGEGARDDRERDGHAGAAGVDVGDREAGVGEIEADLLGGGVGRRGARRRRVVDRGDVDRDRVRRRIEIDAGRGAAVVLHLEGEARVAGAVGVRRRGEHEAPERDGGGRDEVPDVQRAAVVGERAGERQARDAHGEEGVGRRVARIGEPEVGERQRCRRCPRRWSPSRRCRPARR